ncbi:GntR family transcriptional regulator [Actinomadura rupiterrae]|uniref:GntR family transcriptional regulator n=1 Tax=Actinomadura rupiterrae TaxID=559627 RepID=UPI0020A61B2A|nr:GntR family transcriptional regulator [Actinomadura rupiterrae]MCP2337191.1 DNA-binding GntR family transcriptional regulator [Actinomadura rupiterrae]
MSDDWQYLPKYQQIMQVLRGRIADGTYRVGDKLPSESQLIKEFGTSRPTVTRALNDMQLRGEVERVHGRGTFVKAVVSTDPDPNRPGLAVLDRHETAETVKVVEVGRRPAPPEIAELLGLSADAPAFLRRYVSIYDQIPSELVSLWLPLDIARATGLEVAGPLTVPARELLSSAHDERLVRIDERLSARRATEQETEILELDAHEPVLAVLGVIRDASGRGVLAVDLALPGTLHELTDTFSI